MQGGFFAGLGSGLGNIMEGVLKEALKGIECSDALRVGLKEAMTAAATTSISTAMNGGDLAKNLMVSVGSSAFSSFIFPSKGELHELLNSKDTLTKAREATIQGLVTGTVNSVVTKTSLGESLILSGLGGALNSFAASQGQGIADRREKYLQNIKASKALAPTLTSAPTTSPNPLKNTFGTTNEELHRFYTPSYNSRSASTKDRGGKLENQDVSHKNKPKANGSAKQKQVKPNTATTKNQIGGNENSINHNHANATSGNGSYKSTSLGEDILDFFIPAAHAEEIVPASQARNSRKSNKPENQPGVLIDSEPKVGFVETCLIGSGRAFAKLGQGIQQFGLEIGEQIGFVEQGKTARYTRQINEESQFYAGTSVGKSLVGKTAEVMTDIGLVVAIPGGTAVRGTKFVMNVAGISALSMGLQATQDGTLATRFQNVALGATFGVIAGAAGAYVIPKAKDALMPLYNAGKSRLSAIEGFSGQQYKPLTTSSNSAFNSYKIKEYFLEPAYNGKLYSPEKLQQLVKYLERRNVFVYETKGHPAFTALADRTGRMYLPERPTALQVKHELSHYIDFRNQGFESYAKMGRIERERSVLERLQKNRIWKELNELEKQFSVNYVDNLVKNMEKPVQ